MDNFEFYKTIRISKNKSLRDQILTVHNVYNRVPATQGCLANINKEGGCNGKCCQFQSPQVLYCEFLNVWDRIIKKWDTKQILELIENCLINYVKGFTTKGCVFFDKDSKLCKIHKWRSLSCRVYGITSKEEFQLRFEKTKQLYKDCPDAVLMEQCSLVSTINGKEITIEDTNEWWSQLVAIERRIGIEKDNINDGMGGSYRSFHDHILLYMLPDTIMQHLQGVRISSDMNRKIGAVKEYMQKVRSSFVDE